MFFHVHADPLIALSWLAKGNFLSGVQSMIDSEAIGSDYDTGIPQGNQEIFDC
jgi:hypothetical protein